MQPHSKTMTRPPDLHCQFFSRSSIVWKDMRNLDLTTFVRGEGKQVIDERHESAWSQRPDGLKGRLTSCLIYNRNNKSSR